MCMCVCKYIYEWEIKKGTLLYKIKFSEVCKTNTVTCAESILILNCLTKASMRLKCLKIPYELHSFPYYCG